MICRMAGTGLSPRQFGEFITAFRREGAEPGSVCHVGHLSPGVA
jgi:hypothetical protein